MNLEGFSHCYVVVNSSVVVLIFFVLSINYLHVKFLLLMQNQRR